MLSEVFYTFAITSGCALVLSIAKLFALPGFIVVKSTSELSKNDLPSSLFCDTVLLLKS